MRSKQPARSLAFSSNKLTSPQIVLKHGREKSLLRRHPWVFSGAVDEVRGNPQPGATVEILADSGEFLAQAAYSPQSQIRARVWTWRREITVDRGFFRKRIERAIASRAAIGSSNAYRLLHAESDGLPGLVVDKYGDVLVFQCLSQGVEFWRETIIDVLDEQLKPAAIVERSEAEVRKLEGLPERSEIVKGKLEQNQIEIREHDLKLKVDVSSGHKTGFYLDQRDNRLAVRGLAAGRDVLDCFSYTGGFAVNALKGGAKSVTLIEDSGEALELAKENIRMNGFDPEGCEFINGDAFQVLRRFRDQDRQFDLVILDPPKFAPNKAQAERASRGYKDINLLAFKLLRPGGSLVTFSCSGGVDAALFQKIVAGAALDAGVEAWILHRLSQAPDHPVALNFPEGEYLKGLVIEISI
jgi:23S rRNA (cytosine1962-C5)-methyltransferase